jgi:hypothetical protein
MEDTKDTLVEKVRLSRKRKREERTKKEKEKIKYWEQRDIQRAKEKADAEIKQIKDQAARKRAKLDLENYDDVDPDDTLCLYTCDELKRMLD